LVNAGSLDESTVRDALTDAARGAGLHDTEIEPTIESALKRVDGKARTVPERSPVQPPSETPESQPAANPRIKTTSSLEDRLLTPTRLRTLPEPTPLIDNVLDQGTIALLYGKWASSKSFIALDWACSVASGRPWQDRGTRQTRVLYVVAEGAAGFAGRLTAWETGWRTKVEDRWMQFLPMPINLMTQDVDTLTNLVNEGEYGFVVLDTLARCMVGGDENSARDAGVVVDAMTQLLMATPNRRGVILGVHHTGKDGRTLRGSSAFEAGADTVYFTERDGQAVTLKRTKRKDGPEADVHKLRLSNVEGSGSCVVESISGENPHENQAESTNLLRKIFSASFSSTGVSNSELRQMATERDMSQSSYYRARAELLQEGWIVNTGTATRPFYQLASQLEE
jgi:hypothetical protein